MMKKSIRFWTICVTACFGGMFSISAVHAEGRGSPDGIDRSGMSQELRIKRYAPAIMPDRSSTDALVFPRGAQAPCDFPVCDTMVYQNIGEENIATGFGDQDGVPFYDDITMVGTDRFLCRMEFSLGGLGDGGEIVPCTLTLRTGNISPDCPDSPNSMILFETTINVPMTNPFNLIVFTFDPPLLVDQDFLWVGWSTAAELGDTDASWGINGPAEIGSTADLFVIPNGDGQCTFGAGGDYFFFGGSPIAGMEMTVFANPGPPGACCYRDEADPMGDPGDALCQVGVTRAECLISTVNVWKEGVCEDFDLTDPVCDLCLSDDECMLGDPEGEMNCSAGYHDLFNQGCSESPFAFSPIECGQTICGTGGTYNNFCTTNVNCGTGQTCENNVCTGPNNARDNDWYQFVLTEDTEVTFNYTARFAGEISLMQNGGDPTRCPVAINAFLDFADGRACETLTITRCLPPGTWILRTRPTLFQGIPCDTKYQLSMTCLPCDLEEGACCDTTPAGCSEMAEIACVGRVGIYKGDNTTCAVEGLDCPGVPGNNLCLVNKSTFQLGGISTSATFNTQFATTDDLPTHPGADIPNDCSVGELSAINVAIQADVFYNYRIPTNFNGTAVTQGLVVISTRGSAYDTKVVVYGNPNGSNPCGTGGCSRPQYDCNDDVLAQDALPAKFNALSHLVIPVANGTPDGFETGECLKIRIGGEGVAAASRGAGQINIDFIPRGNQDPFSEQTGRCCFDDGSCLITTNDAECLGLNGYPRPLNDFNQGDPAVIEQVAGCQADPCPDVGEACFRAIDFNALVGTSGTATRDIRNVVYYKYTLPASGGVVIDSCGTGGFNAAIAVYSQTLFNGDCDLGSILAFNDECTVTESTASGALLTSTCYGGLNSTFNSCLCLQVGSHPDLEAGDDIIIALGRSPLFLGFNLFGDSARHVQDPVLNDLGGTVPSVVNITHVPSGCFECPADCPGEGIPEGNDLICEDTNNPEPSDTFNGGCNATPPSFNSVALDCNSGPVTICGTAGNYLHPFPCDNAFECPGNAQCSGPDGFCIDATLFVNRDEDWFRITVDQPSTISWRVLNSQFPAEIAIFGNPDGTCSPLFVFASDEGSFGCDPDKGGTPVQLEASAEVCAGTYFLRITNSIFGGLGDTECTAKYVVQAECEPFPAQTCCEGDMNADGHVNGLDIQKWIATLFNPPTVFDDFLGCFAANYCRADINKDGEITMSDMGGFVDLLVTANKPVCDAPAACGSPETSQLPNDGVTRSDLDTTAVLVDSRAADCFRPLENGSVQRVCWWGGYQRVTGDTCPAESDCFLISIHDPRSGCDVGTANRCPGTRRCNPPGLEDPPGCAQYVANVVRAATGGGITTATATLTEFFYVATLPVPMPVSAGQCYWLEIVNSTPPNDCNWQWEQSNQGDTRHAWVEANSIPGDLPTNYDDCAVQERDLAFSLNLRIAKDGCGKPRGRCCYDAAPYGSISCQPNSTEEDCVFVLNGEWSIEGTCGPANPECTPGRCCYLDEFQVAQCVETLQSTCTRELGGLWSAGECPCPDGRCCIEGDCSSPVAEVACLSQGGIWTEGADCSSACPTGICGIAGVEAPQCQIPHLIEGVQQGGYVSDADNEVSVADDFRTAFTDGANYVDQLCWRGFHRQGTADCSPLAENETFTITFYYQSVGQTPDTGNVIAQFVDITPLKSEPAIAEGVNFPAGAASVQYTYEAFLPTPVQVTSGAAHCFWVEIVNTTPNLSCVWFWSTSAQGNQRAAIRKTGMAANAFPYQMVDRDLSFCYGPVTRNSASCTVPTIPAPANDQCGNAEHLGTGPAGPVDGTTHGAAKENSEAGCNPAANSRDVFYTWTQGGTAVATTFSLCFLNTTFDATISVHKTAGLPNNGCPTSNATESQISTLFGCNTDGCPAGFGTNFLFFQGRQPRVQVASANAPMALPADNTFIIRVAGETKGGTSVNPPDGFFTIQVTQP